MDTEPSIQKEGFVVPEIPQTIVSPEEQIDYLVTHYWDNFNFSDTAHFQEEIMELAFSDYVTILPHTQKETADMSIAALLKNAEYGGSRRTYDFFLDLFRKYLYAPTSPFRNDEYYMPVAEYVLDDSTSTFEEKERMRFDLDILKKNRIGHLANNFTYTLASGKGGALHGGWKKYTVLLFYNPDCGACAKMINELKNSTLVNSALEKNWLAVLAVYPDSDIEAWRQHLKDIPESWVNAYDIKQEILHKRLYDLKAMPTLYFLDNDRRVILKDTEFEVLEKWISDNLTL